ncbi:MAG: BatB protein, partial [Oleibacter sp.]|nr:BatB protein [Thalassolituus sp.]
MLSMQWPWVFLLLPLPWLVRYLIAPKAKAEAALKVASLSDWGTQTIGIENSQRNSLWSWLLPLLVWISLLVALAQPMWIGDPIRLPASGRDLMLAVDLSGSMDTGDMQLEGRSVNR